jgi:hypothetical protein
LRRKKRDLSQEISSRFISKQQEDQSILQMHQRLLLSAAKVDLHSSSKSIQIAPKKGHPRIASQEEAVAEIIVITTTATIRREREEEPVVQGAEITSLRITTVEGSSGEDVYIPYFN